MKTPVDHPLTSQNGWGKSHKAQALDEELQAVNGYGKTENQISLGRTLLIGYPGSQTQTHMCLSNSE